jgi:thymidylate synthase (FAD)
MGAMMNDVLGKLNRTVGLAGISFEYPSFQISSMPTKESIRQFEVAARTCYRSEDKMTDDLSSAESLLDRIMRLNHTAMIEFLPDMAVKFRTNRGVTHELVRMRLCSFAQESTRYVKYNEVPFIIPSFMNASSLLDAPLLPKNSLFLASCLSSADVYSKRLDAGHTPQEARGSLNNDVATYINVKANMREWFHIFKLRCEKVAHPDMRLLMCGFASYLFCNNDFFREMLSKHFVRISQVDIPWFMKSHYIETIEGVHYIVPYVDADCNRDAGDPWADK